MQQGITSNQSLISNHDFIFHHTSLNYRRIRGDLNCRSLSNVKRIVKCVSVKVIDGLFVFNHFSILFDRDGNSRMFPVFDSHFVRGMPIAK